MKKLTILVSLYESGEWIKNRLDNLMQSHANKDSEIWCVNANSPDERDHTIPQEYPVKYLKLDERVSVYKVWNDIIKNSESRYITNANADDIIAPECYTKLMSVLDNNRACSFAYPSWYTTEVPNQSWRGLTAYTSEGGEPGHYNGDINKGGVGHFPLWRRSLHKQVGYFNESFNALGDAEFWARCYYLAHARFFWLAVPLACYLWRGHTNHPNLWHVAVNADEWELYHKKIAEYRSGA